ncbi:MAG: ribokinase, partial [Armatimonadetes bacterium]|nr:ribokinase [Armatimonadota bacterium]
MTPRILVVGSANMDLVVRAPRMPVGGETIMGSDFSTVRGGKGANQAIACARMGAEVWMLGCVGQDAFGDALIEGLETDGVRCDLMRRHSSAPSGIAIIIIDAAGENS